MLQAAFDHEESFFDTPKAWTPHFQLVLKFEISNIDIFQKLKFTHVKYHSYIVINHPWSFTSFSFSTLLNKGNWLFLAKFLKKLQTWNQDYYVLIQMDMVERLKFHLNITTSLQKCVKKHYDRLFLQYENVWKGRWRISFDAKLVPSPIQKASLSIE